MFRYELIDILGMFISPTLVDSIREFMEKTVYRGGPQMDFISSLPFYKRYYYKLKVYADNRSINGGLQSYLIRLF